MNIYDIAREAGVSIATISRVINGKSMVSGKTRDRVEAIMKKYGYTPDPTARSLVVKATKTVAILAGDLRDPGSGGICCAVERGLRGTGYAVLLCCTDGTAQGISGGFAAALARRADAVVAVEMVREAEGAAVEAAKRVPVVVVDDFIDASGVYSVICDEIYGMMLAVGHLTGRGRRDLCYVQDSAESYGAKKLEEGFEVGMAMNGLSSGGRVIEAERGFDGGYSCAETLLRDGRALDAVICGDDSTAAGFVHCLRQNFLDVPEDVAVVALRNTPVAQCAEPPLTAVDRQSSAAAKLLTGIFAGGRAERKSVVLPRLVVRESA